MNGDWLSNLDAREALLAMTTIASGAPADLVAAAAKNQQDILKTLVLQGTLSQNQANEIQQIANSMVLVCVRCKKAVDVEELQKLLCTCGSPLKMFGTREEFEERIQFGESSIPRFYAGRYKLLKKLGAGGMGVVFATQDLELAREVAIKILKLDNPEQRQRFQKEAIATAKLEHPGIIKIYDSGSYENALYYSMELLNGDSLDALVGKLSRAAVLKIVETAH